MVLVRWFRRSGPLSYSQSHITPGFTRGTGRNEEGLPSWAPEWTVLLLIRRWVPICPEEVKQQRGCRAREVRVAPVFVPVLRVVVPLVVIPSSPDVPATPAPLSRGSNDLYVRRGRKHGGRRG